MTDDEREREREREEVGTLLDDWMARRRSYLAGLRLGTAAVLLLPPALDVPWPLLESVGWEGEGEVSR
jgi:hypothetical protein